MDSFFEVERFALAMDTNVARSDHTAIATLVGPVKCILPHLSHSQTNDVTLLVWRYFQTTTAGISDFVIAEGLDCDVNEVAITVLSITVICLATVCNLLTCRHIYFRSLTMNFRTADAKCFFPFFFLLHGVGDFLFSVLKVSGRNRPLVGKDVSVTIVVVFLPIFCYCGLVLYYQVVMKFLKGYSCMMSPESRDKVDKRFAYLQSKSILIPPLSLVPCVMPLFSIPFPQYVAEFGKVYLVGNGILAASYGLLFYFAVGFLLKELFVYFKTSSMVADDILVVYRRLKLANRAGTLLFLTLGISYIIFGCSTNPDLILKSSYLFLIIQILTHPTLTILTLTVSHISHRKISNSEPVFSFAVVSEQHSVHNTSTLI